MSNAVVIQSTEKKCIKEDGIYFSFTCLTDVVPVVVVLQHVDKAVLGIAKHRTVKLSTLLGLLSRNRVVPRESQVQMKGSTLSHR